MIAVLLSTYNGEKYLEEQLNSLTNQTCTDWILFVRDDCSTDNTPEIICNFKLQQPHKVVVINNEGVNLGAKKSFIKLLEIADADYYMFCDQDDVWLPHKIELSLEQVKTEEDKDSTKAILAFCDAIVTDEDLNIISNSFWKFTKVNPFTLMKRNRLQVFNCAPGCTMIFNNSLKMLAFPFPEKVSMHDWWIAIVAQRGGKICPIKERLIFYRQHASNTIGATDISKNYFVRKLQNISKVREVQRQHLQFLNEIGGINAFEFYVIKILYNFRRFFS